MSRQDFFNTVRPLFNGGLNGDQVKGMEAILDARPIDLTMNAVAYCFATAFHETGQKMTPCVENLTYKTASRIRAVWPTRFLTEASAKPYVEKPRELANKVYGGRMGNVGADDGWTYRGRGLPQITGKENYQRATKRLREMGFDVDFVKNPDDVLKPQYAAIIMFQGMREGWFTGKSLDDYFNARLADPKNARRIINGTDEADKIAGYWKTFRAGLVKLGVEPEPVAPVIPPPPDVEPAPVATAPAPSASNAQIAGLTAAFMAALVALLTALGVDVSTLKSMLP